MKLSIARHMDRLAKLYRNAGRNHVEAMRLLDKAAAEFVTAHKYKAKIERAKRLKKEGFDAGKGSLSPVTTPCFKCGVQFDEDGDRHYVGGKPCCSDCYYEALGDEMEKNPPINPHFVKQMEQRKKSRQ